MKMQDAIKASPKGIATRSQIKSMVFYGNQRHDVLFEYTATSKGGFSWEARKKGGKYILTSTQRDEYAILAEDWQPVN